MSGLFGGDSSPPPPPPPPKPTPPMPDLQSPQVLEQERMTTAAILARGGRQSTILSEGKDSGPYTKKTLGG